MPQFRVQLAPIIFETTLCSRAKNATVNLPPAAFFLGKNLCHGTFEFQMAHKNFRLVAKTAHDFRIHPHKELHKISHVS